MFNSCHSSLPQSLLPAHDTKTIDLTEEMKFAMKARVRKKRHLSTVLCTFIKITKYNEKTTLNIKTHTINSFSILQNYVPRQ